MRPDELGGDAEVEHRAHQRAGHPGERPIALVGEHEIGWLVREDRWRQGFAREMVEAVLEWAFTRHAAPHVVALTSQANVPSWRLMERIGMRRCTDLDFDDPRFPPEENPTILYSLSHEEWRNRA